MKEQVKRESLALTEECLKLLFIFHTLAQGSEHQHHFTLLLLEALYLVFYQSNECHAEVIQLMIRLDLITGDIELNGDIVHVATQRSRANSI